MGRLARTVRAALAAVLLLQAGAALATALLPPFRTLDGVAVAAASMHGKVTVVALFSVTCPFCMNEAPKLQKLYRENRAVLNVVAVNVDRNDALAGAHAWKRKYGLTHLVTADRMPFEAALGKPKGIPSLYVFDRSGSLVRTEVGEMLDEDFDDIARYAQAQRPVAAAPGPAVPFAADLRQDSLAASRAGTPLVLFFTLPDCAYCHAVRQNYLAPLVRGEGGQRYTVREIVIGGKRRAAGLDGKTASHRELALRFKARFGPTVLFVDGAGNALAPPLIGGDTAGMYGAYLDNRLAAARARLAAPVN
ncbi:redoxin family protein [Massilia soli]|uniref:Redoxin family protein n=1 Tax=Massilia soli TaxID=2792854 RepID=A0ABS7SUG3_9BURK|nr:redoxin family protein [Massilia soli]MBZ2209589.1 redoxin family protein [Massilia soli]